MLLIVLITIQYPRVDLSFHLLFAEMLHRPSVDARQLIFFNELHELFVEIITLFNQYLLIQLN